MVESKAEIKNSNCLNCGEEVSGNYCSNCGQKFQPTKVPLRLFLDDVVETLFTIDNRLFRTLRDLFLKPGKVTIDYIEGRRAKYLPPLRIYLSISVVYFLFAQFIESDKILFVNFTQDAESDLNLAKIIQTGLFFLVPVLALILKIFHRKRKAFYIEYLIFSVHLHSVWFVLFTIQMLIGFLVTILGDGLSSTVNNAVSIFGETFQIGAMIFLVISVKKVFGENWMKAIFKSISTLFIYLLSLGLVTFLAIWVL